MLLGPAAEGRIHAKSYARPVIRAGEPVRFPRWLVWDRYCVCSRDTTPPCHVVEPLDKELRYRCGSLSDRQRPGPGRREGEIVVE